MSSSADSDSLSSSVRTRSEFARDFWNYDITDVSQAFHARMMRFGQKFWRNGVILRGGLGRVSKSNKPRQTFSASSASIAALQASQNRADVDLSSEQRFGSERDVCRSEMRQYEEVPVGSLVGIYKYRNLIPTNERFPELYDRAYWLYARLRGLLICTIPCSISFYSSPVLSSKTMLDAVVASALAMLRAS